MSAIALNLCEGVRRTGRDKKRAYRIAAAESQEVRVLADRVGRVTYALAR